MDNTTKYTLWIIFLFVFVFLEIVLFTKIFSIQTDNISVTKTEDQKIKEFYENEVATKVSPHHVRKAMATGDYNFILVDVRSPEEYIDEHISTAVNIPAYLDKENTTSNVSARIINDFKKIEEENPDKEIVIYCYSYACMTGKKIGNLLAQNEIYVKELSVGWNEWRYFWEQWNYPHEWESIDPEDYITKGKKPGTVKPDPNLSTGCSVDGDLGC